MAKINHSNYLDIVDNVWSAAKEKGIMHLNSKENFFDGNFFEIGDKKLVNFGTCGYMGLESHPNLIENAINLTRKYGTQLSMSRAYIRPKYIQELEELMSEIFDGNKVICYTSTSNAHISVIANLIKYDHLLILDQQLHFSVQFPAKNTRLQGTTVKMVKHSDWEALETMIREEYNKYEKIWYMADGVYSMHGDLPDTDKLKQLLNKYPKLNLYFDDAHGMSWAGKKGTGYIYDRLGVNDRIVIISTLAKGFGCVGGTAILANNEDYRKIDIFGGPLSYSHPLSPANVGAAIASAKIHLSSEIDSYQLELNDLMEHMNCRLKENNLTNLSAPYSPIYFIGSGLNKVTRNFVHRILNEGYYVNTATFPVVANDKSGLRFTLTRHNTKDDIDGLVQAMAYHLPKAIEEEGDSIKRVYNDFGFNFEQKKEIEEKSEFGLKIFEYDTIKEINQEEWDAMFENRGTISYEGLLCNEEIFSNNSKLEENWDFQYLIIKDYENKIVFSTFFTIALYKDDMLTLEIVSSELEEIRKKNPYYLTTKTLAMGALFSEGDYIYFDNNHKLSDLALKEFFKYVEKIKNKFDCKSVLFRDFFEESIFNQIFEDEGYGKINMPNTNIVELPKWKNNDELFNLLSSKNAISNIKRYVLKYQDQFDIVYKNNLTEIEAEEHFNLFKNVKEANLAFNFFIYPKKMPAILSKYKEWEFIEFRLKENNKMIGCIWGYIGKDHYSPLIVGLDYNYLKTHHVYKQVMYYMVKRGNDLNKKKTYLGLTADYEKKKYGAISKQTFAYIKFDDLYNADILSSLSNN